MADEELPTWDEAARPVPPEYPEAGPGQQLAGEHLRAVHEMYRGGLETVAAVVAAVVDGTAPVGQARAALHGLGLTEQYQRLGSFCGQICQAVRAHHAIEDTHLYPPLRAADDRLGPVLDRLDEEHVVVHDLLERLDASLVALAGAPSDLTRLRRVVEEFRRLRELLLSHFTYEEDAIGTALGVHHVMV